MKDKEVALYNIIECYKIEGEVELARLKSAVEKLVYNNEILRTSFGYEVNDFYQFIHDYVDVDIEYEENLEIDIEAAYMEYARPFDLGKAPLFRIKVVSVDSGMYLLLDIHHIISDGTGDELFKHMLLDEYHGKTVIPEFQFKDYSEWERGRDYSVQREYWNDKLRDLPERLNLPFRGKRTKIRGYKGGSISKKIENDLIDKIKQFCLINNCSEFMFLLSVYMILLHKYSKQDDILVGTPIAGRTIKGTERMLGMFVNTVVLRGNPEEKKNYMDFLTEIRKMVFDSLENQDYPFDKLAVDLKEKQDVSINDIVDVMFIVQNTEKLQEQNTGLKLIDVNMPEIVSKYDITLEILDNYEIVCEYSYDLFDIDTAKRILLHYIELLKQILNNPNSEIEKLSVISEEEKNTILYTFNRDYAVKREECGIVNAFLDIAKRYPSALAVIEESECITYQELDEYSSAFASELVKRGVKRNEYVALILDKGIETVVGIMGILKAGAVYVPIDHNLPLERIRYILNDCKAKIAVYKEENEIKELLLDMKIVCLSTTRGKITENIVQFEKYSHNDLAYLIYTSGTTGNPKGVMIREEGLLYLCRDFIERFNLKPDVRVLQHTNISFDPFIEEVFPVLLSGATVVVTPDNAKEDYNLLCDYMYNKNVDIADFCPLVLAELLPYLERKHCVKQIICGGDNLSAFLKTAILQLDIELFNNYGPSEITVDATCYECTDDPRNIIGKPFGDKKIYIMNGNQLCGIGVPGEICITGKGLAVGYLNLPELTAEKFVNNPFGEGRMYRSGDLARWLPDGNIEYMGRIDEQIKIRGHRIELGEIESRIQEIEGVKESAVIAREDRNGEKAIYAYYTGEGVGISEIRDRLSEVLPNYMVPAYMMEIESIPKTRNGKLDKRMLPNIEIKLGKEYVAPENQMEKMICKIFEEILSLEKVGVEDNFFELGGHSLRATRLVNRIEAETGVRIALKDIFIQSTPRKLSDYICISSGDSYASIPMAEEKDYYPMSSAQKRIYLIQQMNPEGVMYNMPQVLKLYGNVNIDRFKAVLTEIVARHEVLRTEFLMIEGNPVQNILKEVTIPFEYVEMTDKDDNEEIKEFVRAFDLSKAPQIRVRLVKRDEYILFMLDMHHIIGDGMSIGTFLNEINSLYRGEKLPELTKQFKDYSEWMSTRNLDKQKSYWISQFEDEIPTLDMPLDYIRPKEQSFAGGTVERVLDEELAYQIKKLAFEKGVTEYMIFLSAVMIMLGKYSRQEDIVIGSPISGRTHKDTEGMLGMFVNTLAMRGKPEKSESYSAFLNEIKEMCLKAYENQEYPFEELVETVNVQREMSRNPLFDVMLVLQNNEEAKIELKDVEAEIWNGENNAAAFDLTFEIEEDDAKYIIMLEYCTALFKKETVNYMLVHLEEILRQLTANEHIMIGDIAMASQEEQDMIKKEFNATEVQYSVEKNIVDVFEKQVSKTPNNNAVVFEERTITYKELNAKSNNLANILYNMGIQKDEYVVLLTERSIEMIIGIMGVLKAGGAYVPVDINYPEERIRYILEDCKPKAVVYYHPVREESGEIRNTVEKIRNSIAKDFRIIDLYDLKKDEDTNENLVITRAENDLAYCIYTSGTTGKPKGVMIENSGVCNLGMFYINEHKIDKNDRILMFASYVFDASVTEIMSALMSGATLYVASSELRTDIVKLEKYIKSNKISVVLLPPILVNQLNIEGPRLVITAGSESSKKIIEKCENILVYSNDYGPTEGTVGTSFWKYKQGDAFPDRIPIGKPISNKKVYIIEGEKLCGIGVPGELCIAGEGIARGYLNKPELTEEKFVDNPYGKGKMYRSGDLARWMADGNIEFLGRIDKQVKIRGFRVELGEIERCVREIEGVTESAVIIRKDSDGENMICAYYTGNEVSVSYIRNRLREVLPEYMIPSYIMKIEIIPLTVNGKLNEKALMDIELKTDNIYVQPRSAVEEYLCRTFEELLCVKQVGIKDSFFELGGHSLRLMRLVNRIEADLGVRLSVKDIFNNLTPEKLYQLINIEKRNEYKPISRAEEKDYYPMSSAQKRIYLIQQMNPEGVMYNMPQVLKVYGNVNIDRFKAVLTEIVARHEVLRTEFLMIEGNPVQNILNEVTIPFEYVEMTDKDDNEEIKEFVRAFDLSKAPQIRVRLVKRDEYILFMLDMHHIIGDGMSIGTFLNEINSLYRGEKLPELTKQFKDYSEWMSTRNLDKQKSYWISQFEDEIPTLDMPLDYIRPKEQSFAGGTVERVLDEELAYQIKKLASEEGVTEYMIFLSAAMIMLSKYSNQEDIVIGSPISGRTHKDTEGMLGVFVNTLAMRGKPEKSKSYSSFLNEIKEMCLKAYENQEYPFEELVESVDVQRDMSRNPLFDVMFIMQNNEKTNFILDGAKIEEYDDEIHISKMDITFEINEINNCFKVMFEYCTALYNKDTVNRMLLHFEEILKQIMNDKTIKIGKIDMVTSLEKQDILVRFNSTNVEYPKEQTVVELFEKQVKKTPDNVAVVFEGNELSYEQLNRRANIIANKLREEGVEREDYVAIIADRSIEMIIGIYGIIKAGGTYVPIDPTYPDERIDFMLHDCQAKIVLLYGDELKINSTIQQIDLKDLEVWKGNEDNPAHINSPEDLLYCIYTSGTTGKPKGVMIQNYNVVNYSMCSRYDIMKYAYDNRLTKMVSVTNMIFDIFVTEIITTLLNGLTVYIANYDEQRELSSFEKLVTSNEIEILQTTPSRIKQMLMQGDCSNVLKSLKFIMLGGEYVSGDLVSKLKEYADVYVENVYGSSETTVWSSYYEYKDGRNRIGRPISNTQIYIVNGNSLCGVGVPGELCIAGDGLARGYLNRPELTAEKFVNNPYGEGKMYHTGDLARWMPDGNIEYLGRIDEQVKIRGHRIELGEIESRIREIKEVKECAVITKEDSSGEKAIYAYYTGGGIQVSEIRERLSEVLPEYMIPAYMREIENIPITKNGKLDKRALPDIEVKATKEYEAPQDEYQIAVINEMKSLLHVENVGLNDDFFQLGGNSIKATLAVIHLNKLGYKITIKELITLREMKKIANIIKIKDQL